jgi:hypothetical protein
MPETSNPQAVGEVVKGFYFEPTSGEKSTTLPQSEVREAAMTPNVTDLSATLELAAKLDQCDTWAQIQELCVGVSDEVFEEALGLLEDNGDRVRRLQADAAVVTSKPETVTPASDATTNKDAAATTVGKEFRYVGVLSHKLKDAEGNPILDAAGKPVVLKKGSDILLEDVGGAVNPDYANVRPIGFESQALGLLRSQLEEV